MIDQGDKSNTNDNQWSTKMTRTTPMIINDQSGVLEKLPPFYPEVIAVLWASSYLARTYKRWLIYSFTFRFFSLLSLIKFFYFVEMKLIIFSSSFHFLIRNLNLCQCLLAKIIEIKEQTSLFLFLQVHTNLHDQRQSSYLGWMGR